MNELNFKVVLDCSTQPRANIVELLAHVILAMQGLAMRIDPESRSAGCVRLAEADSESLTLTLTARTRATQTRIAVLRDVLNLGLDEYLEQFADPAEPRPDDDYTLDEKSSPMALRVPGPRSLLKAACLVAAVMHLNDERPEQAWALDLAGSPRTLAIAGVLRPSSRSLGELRQLLAETVARAARDYAESLRPPLNPPPLVEAIFD